MIAQPTGHLSKQVSGWPYNDRRGYMMYYLRRITLWVAYACAINGVVIGSPSSERLLDEYETRVLNLKRDTKRLTPL
ncbi:hypothetical protein HY312_03245 [Candidatus Saccharibacteria bacterium]|nr:hypothetical protein [Candidatus Saccharibacteria bacterium]